MYEKNIPRHLRKKPHSASPANLRPQFLGEVPAESEPEAAEEEAEEPEAVAEEETKAEDFPFLKELDVRQVENPEKEEAPKRPPTDLKGGDPDLGNFFDGEA